MRRKETDGVIKSSHGKKPGVENEDESAKKVFFRKYLCCRYISHSVDLAYACLLFVLAKFISLSDAVISFVINGCYSRPGEWRAVSG